MNYWRWFLYGSYFYKCSGASSLFAYIEDTIDENKEDDDQGEEYEDSYDQEESNYSSYIGTYTIMVDASAQSVELKNIYHPRLNKHIQFPFSSLLSPPTPPKVLQHESTPCQADTTLLLSSLIQTTIKVSLSPPRQVISPIPLISSLQTAVVFQGDSCFSNFQATFLS
ncbi:unnamed protein product [Lactuca saligna]|uniref:Uncharacterized protein n=1 Tax=Lactuca saligna TaxID=75948 RepID=A0AA36E390_LACSI|nr:unnamed protein product [Lactuca saligna]